MTLMFIVYVAATVAWLILGIGYATKKIEPTRFSSAITAILLAFHLFINILPE